MKHPWFFPAGDYIGQMKNGLAHGKGTYTSSFKGKKNGRTYKYYYKGDFVNGERHGKATQIIHLPTYFIKYQGGFKNDVPHGHGVSINKYKGKLETNKRIGPFEDEVYARDGYRCRYCEIRVIDFKVLEHMEKLVGSENFKAAGRGNKIRHGISLTFRATADHVVPISHGGRSSIDNLVTSCWNCNYGKYNALLEKMNLENPFNYGVVSKLKWDGRLSNV